MTRAVRTATIFAVLAAGAVLAPGCGANNDCTQTPEVGKAPPSSCTLAANQPVTVNVKWCDCGASTACDVVVEESSGVIQLEPKVNSCDASCPTNPSSCPATSVACRFTAPAAGAYTFYVISGQSSVNVPVTVASGGNATCG